MLYETEEENKARRPFNTVLQNCVVDTAFTPDTNFWETGIKYGKWIIVDQYNNKQEAKAGHNKWILYMKTNPKRLYEIMWDEWVLLREEAKGGKYYDIKK